MTTPTTTHHNEPTSGATPKRAMQDDALIEALVEGNTQIAAGRIAGMSERTVRRRLDDRDFTRALHARRRAVHDTSRGRLVASLAEAIDTLEDLMANASSEQVRLSAATKILQAGSDIAHDDLNDRIADLEDHLNQPTPISPFNPPGLLGDDTPAVASDE